MLSVEDVKKRFGRKREFVSPIIYIKHDDEEIELYEATVEIRNNSLKISSNKHKTSMSPDKKTTFEIVFYFRFECFRDLKITEGQIEAVAEDTSKNRTKVDLRIT